ncbi:hypothetical protein BDF19DRAFT_411857 [Syncephalis fuscata]|nr:hypothetical protein BDF19DRAFT_411857 [Syncephalis fuscata]
MPNWFRRKKRRSVGVLTDDTSTVNIPMLADHEQSNALATRSSITPSIGHSRNISALSQESDVNQNSATQSGSLNNASEHNDGSHDIQQQVVSTRDAPNKTLGHEDNLPFVAHAGGPSSSRFQIQEESQIISTVPKNRMARSTSIEHVSAPRSRSWNVWRRIRPRERYSNIHPNDRPYFKAFVNNAQWLDGRRICCGCCRVGADAILGFIPVIGDFAGAGLSLALVRKAQKQWHLPPDLVSRMYTNIIVDTALGLIPVIGIFLDIAHKSNMKNARLIEEHLSGLYRQGKCGVTDQAHLSPVPASEHPDDVSDSD